MPEIVRLDDHEPREVSDGFEVVQLGANDFMSIQYFRFMPGGSAPEHDHPHQQIGFVYRGELTFTVEGEEVTIGPGDTYSLYSHEVHAAENTGDTPVEGVDVFCPPRGAADWME